MTDTVIERARRHAENERLFREVAEGDQDEFELFCECGATPCAERLIVSLWDFLRVRRWDSRFFLTPGHEDQEVENVVERHERWLVVQTHEPFRAFPPNERRRPGRPWS